MDDIYTELKWTSVADTFPAKFDLRDRGTVTPVRSQSPWGTCWSFATIAASENSILNSLGLTTDSYREKYGEELDLSEKHLAWFTTKALPALQDYPEGEYPYEASQAGEGLHFLEGTDIEPLRNGYRAAEYRRKLFPVLCEPCLRHRYPQGKVCPLCQQRGKRRKERGLESSGGRPLCRQLRAEKCQHAPVTCLL